MEGASHPARLMTVAEVAEMLAVPKSWVYAKVAAKEIPHLHVGRYVRFVYAEIVRWIGERNGRA